LKTLIPLTGIDPSTNLDIPKANQQSMYEYTKQILTKVSFDRNLFRKELIKALRILKRDERRLLKIWCVATFATYSDVVLDVFRKFSS
jgi:hypothetical protein